MLKELLKIYLAVMDLLEDCICLLECQTGCGKTVAEHLWMIPLFAFSLACVVLRLGIWLTCGLVPSFVVYQITHRIMAVPYYNAMDVATIVFVFVGLPIMVYLRRQVKRIREWEGLGYY